MWCYLCLCYLFHYTYTHLCFWGLDYSLWYLLDFPWSRLTLTPQVPDILPWKVMVLPLCGDGYCLSPHHGLNSSEVVKVPESDTAVTYSCYKSQISIHLNPPINNALSLIGCVTAMNNSPSTSTSGSFWAITFHFPSGMALEYLSGQQEADLVNLVKASWIAVP